VVIRKRYKRLAVIVGSFAVLFFVIHRALYFAPGVLEHYSSYLVYPVLVTQHKIVTPLKDYFAHRKTITELQEQLAQAQAERDTVLAQNIELQGMISFAQDTQELVEFKQRYNFSQALLAQVLVKNFSEQSHFFLIDKGSAAGAQKDMVVIYKDCLIGRVSEVYPYYSKVVLVSDQTCKVAAYCAQSKATGIYQGTNAEWAANLNHVSHLSSLEIGELILSSGDGLIFPRGFGLGKVKAYHTEGLFHSVSIEPLVDLHAINHCYVVQKGECVQI
jgi:rod shape-determining protein MreC